MNEPRFIPPPLREYQFRSAIPVIGGLIAAFRSVWHSISGRWAIRALAQQQDRINAAAAATLAIQNERTNMLAGVLADQREQAEALNTALADQREQAEMMSVALRHLTESSAAQSAALTDRLAQTEGHLQAAWERIVTRDTAMETALSEVQARLDATAHEAFSRHAALAEETRAGRAATDGHLTTLEAATQLYLEELGHELADLARRVGALAAVDEKQA